METDQGASGFSRRELMASSAAATVLAVTGELSTPAAAAPPAASVELSWLGGHPAVVDQGLTWGVPWPRGAVRHLPALRLSGEGQASAVQSWPLAYWPDGSLKWTGHAASGPIRAGKLRLETGDAAPAAPVQVHEAGDAITIRSGDFAVRIARSGEVLVPEATLGGRRSLANGRLVCLVRDSADVEADAVRSMAFEGTISSATVEQSGPVRAVVKLTGTHNAGGRAWLPFVLRIAVSAGSPSLKLTHSIVFDGDPDKDFIAGLGLRFDVPFADEPHNRHVRFAGEGDGLWSEAVRNIPGWAEGKFKLADRFQDQLAGKPVPTLAEMDAETRDNLGHVPSWDRFKLFQSSPDNFHITKRTNPRSAWIGCDHGRRASGLAYVGGVSGGVAFGLRDFWQRHPTALEIAGATGDVATATIWLWSPDGGAMDLRHYDDKAHGLPMTYEDVQPGHSTPMGVARTSEMTLWVRPATPTRETLVELARALRTPPLLVAAPAYYHQLQTFGIWSLPDDSTPARAAIEKQLVGALDWYIAEVDRRHWYGFWHYGDVRHTYDNDRHCWRYDVGGYAWANSELVPDLWLWYSFLRTGREDVFRMAEAMTRHTSEVDVHHVGPFAPLGSRHNVIHWGDGAKEARISQALLRRFYYYLTADERTGDLMRMVVDADHATVANDPLRQILPKSRFPTHARSGPDWLAFVSNWLTEWERTQDTRWRDKILKGMTDIARMPKGMFSGPPFGYDPATGHLFDIGADFKYSYHLATIFGGAELLFELATLLDVPDFWATWLFYCENYNLPEAERRRTVDDRAIDKNFSAPEWHARLTAYAGARKKDAALSQRAWRELLGDARRKYADIFPWRPQRIEPPLVLEPVNEVKRVSTNHVAQWSLNAIEVLALAGDAAPTALPAGWDGSGSG